MPVPCTRRLEKIKHDVLENSQLVTGPEKFHLTQASVCGHDGLLKSVESRVRASGRRQSSWKEPRLMELPISIGPLCEGPLPGCVMRLPRLLRRQER